MAATEQKKNERSVKRSRAYYGGDDHVSVVMVEFCLVKVTFC